MIKKRLLVSLLCVLASISLFGCQVGGGSDGAQLTQSTNNTGVVIDKSGVWEGNIGFGDSILIIEDNNRLFGFSSASGVNSARYSSIYGDLGKYSSFTGQLQVYDHPRDAFNNSSFNPFGRQQQAVDYTIDFIERQTAEGRIIGLDDVFSLIYSAEYETTAGPQLKGSWFSKYTYESGTTKQGDIHYSAYEVSISVDAEGKISGTATDNISVNWTNPIGPEVLKLSGSFVQNGISGTEIFSVRLDFSSNHGATVFFYEGYAITSLDGADDVLFINAVNPANSEPILLRLARFAP